MSNINSVFVGDNVKYNQGTQTVEKFVIGWVKSQNKSIKIGDLIVSCKTDRTKNEEDAEAKMILQALDKIPGMKIKMNAALTDIQKGKLNLKDGCLIDAVALIEKLDKKEYFKLSSGERPKIMSKTLESIGLVKAAEKKPEKAVNPKIIEEKPVVVEKAPEKLVTLDEHLKTGEGKIFDANIRNMFDTAGLNPNEKDGFEIKIKEIEQQIYDHIANKDNNQPNYAEIDKLTKMPRTGFLVSDYHPLKKEYRSRPADQLVLNMEITPQQNDAQAFKTVAGAFLRLFVTNAEAAELDKALTDNFIDEKTAKEKYHISKELFDLVDGNMDVNGKRDGKITLAELRRANEVIDAYAEVLCHGDRELAIELYKTAPAFKMIDLGTAKSTAERLEKEWGVTDSTTFGQLIGKVNRDLWPALNIEFARLSNKKPEEVMAETIVGKGNTRKICLFIASLPLISQLDPKIQEKLLGVKLPRIFNDEVTEENIIKYVKSDNPVKKEEVKAKQEGPATGQKTKAEKDGKTGKEKSSKPKAPESDGDKISYQ